MYNVHNKIHYLIKPNLEDVCVILRNYMFSTLRHVNFIFTNILVWTY